nr:hypothetical protein CFP56_03287 [Quercus suber]
MANHPPPAPMAPGLGYSIDSHDVSSGFVPAHPEGPKMEVHQEKKPKKPKTPKPIEVVEKELFGYSLEPAPALVGEHKSWQRVGRRTLPFEQQKYACLVRS